MRKDPTFISWKLHSDSSESLARAFELLRQETSPGWVVTEEISTVPDGDPVVHSKDYQIGNYFKEIRLLPTPAIRPAVLRLVFHRLPGAGREWKDLMMRILQRAQRVSKDISVVLDYRGDEDPAELGASVPN
jgi:hypothetical protein